MNRQQVFVVVSSIVVISLFVLFPPYQEAVFRDTGLVGVRFIGYAPLMSPPEADRVVKLDHGRLFLQIASVCVVGLGLYQIVGDRE